MLLGMGVEWVIVPAMKGVLTMWTSHFGYSQLRWVPAAGDLGAAPCRAGLCPAKACSWLLPTSCFHPSWLPSTPATTPGLHLCLHPLYPHLRCFPGEVWLTQLIFYT